MTNARRFAKLSASRRFKSRREPCNGMTISTAYLLGPDNVRAAHSQELELRQIPWLINSTANDDISWHLENVRWILLAVKENISSARGFYARFFVFATANGEERKTAQSNVRESNGAMKTLNKWLLNYVLSHYVARKNEVDWAEKPPSSMLRDKISQMDRAIDAKDFVIKFSERFSLVGVKVGAIFSVGIAELWSCLNRTWADIAPASRSRSDPILVVFCGQILFHYVKLPVTSASISDHCSRTRAPARVNLVRFPPPIICAVECAFPVQESGKTNVNKPSDCDRRKKLCIFVMFGCIFCISAHISQLSNKCS